jgi:YHS domain-containing protein
MQVEPAGAAATSQCNGKTYIFCSPSLLVLNSA